MNEKNLSNGIMRGKRGIVMGVANDRSIAWGIAEAVAKQGAELAFTYQGDALEKMHQKGYYTCATDPEDIKDIISGRRSNT